MGNTEWATGESLVRARIRLLATAEGGKTVPIRGSYRPNHNFFGPENRNMAVGLIDLADGETLNPGENRVLDIIFLTWPGSELYPGREWRIQEGAQLVGTGQVVEVLDRPSGHTPP
jgi:elongation factor Tu